MFSDKQIAENLLGLCTAVIEATHFGPMDWKQTKLTHKKEGLLWNFYFTRDSKIVLSVAAHYASRDQLRLVEVSYFTKGMSFICTLTAGSDLFKMFQQFLLILARGEKK